MIIADITLILPIDVIFEHIGGIMGKDHNDVNRFWVKFRGKVVESGISEKYADQYVKWGEKFALSLKGKPLRKRSFDDIKSFILNGNNEDICQIEVLLERKLGKKILELEVKL